MLAHEPRETVQHRDFGGDVPHGGVWRELANERLTCSCNLFEGGEAPGDDLTSHLGFLAELRLEEFEGTQRILPLALYLPHEGPAFFLQRVRERRPHRLEL